MTSDLTAMEMKIRDLKTRKRKHSEKKKPRLALKPLIPY
ncbi:unnamed protein product [Brassica rapa subsp. trilocularis]